MSIVLGLIFGAIVGAAGLYAFLQVSGRNLLAASRAESDQHRQNVIQDAQNKAKEIELGASRINSSSRNNSSVRMMRPDGNWKTTKSASAKREDTLDRKLDTLSVKEKNLDDLEARLSWTGKVGCRPRRNNSAASFANSATGCCKSAEYPSIRPGNCCFKRVEDECRQEAGGIIQRITEQTQEEAKEKSRQIILQAIQRYAAEQTSDHTVSTVNIPSDDMKGRVIGREGRNIRSFEKATGVDVIIDDTPGLVVVSCFDPVRREVARMSLERLVQDGRIHPARIEEVVAATSKEMEEELLKIGKEAVQEANLPGIPKPVIPDARPAWISYQLWTKRAAPLDGSCLSRAGDGG